MTDSDTTLADYEMEPGETLEARAEPAPTLTESLSFPILILLIWMIFTMCHETTYDKVTNTFYTSIHFLHRCLDAIYDITEVLTITHEALIEFLTALHANLTADLTGRHSAAVIVAVIYGSVMFVAVVLPLAALVVVIEMVNWAVEAAKAVLV